jgi:DNA-binding IclR family transcriptional regulator
MEVIAIVSQSEIASRNVDRVTEVGVLDKAVAVLDAVEAAPRSLAELVDATGLSRATAHRLATALEAHRFIARGADGRFMLGPRLVASDLARLARPALEALRDRTGESAQLYVRQGNHRLCVASLESPHGLRTIVAVGALLPMNAGSAAKILRGDAAALSRGWADSVEEREKGVASVSAPVWDGDRVAAAVSVSGPVQRTTRTPGKRYATAVTKAARAIEAAVG